MCVMQYFQKSIVQFYCVSKVYRVALSTLAITIALERRGEQDDYATPLPPPLPSEAVIKIETVGDSIVLRESHSPMEPTLSGA